jgi:hypothetical protein
MPLFMKFYVRMFGQMGPDYSEDFHKGNEELSLQSSPMRARESRITLPTFMEAVSQGEC